MRGEISRRFIAISWWWAFASAKCFSTPAWCFTAFRRNFLITIKTHLTNYTVVSVPTEILNLDKTMPKFRFPKRNKLRIFSGVDVKLGLIHLFQINCSEVTLACERAFIFGKEGKTFRKFIQKRVKYLFNWLKSIEFSFSTFCYYQNGKHYENLLEFPACQ